MPAYQNGVSIGQDVQKLEPEQDRQTYRRDRTHYHAASAGGNYHITL